MKFRSIIFRKILSAHQLGLVVAAGLPAVVASAATFERGVTYYVTNQSSSTSWDSVLKVSSNSNAWYRIVKINVHGSTEPGAEAGLFRMQATGDKPVGRGIPRLLPVVMPEFVVV